MPEASRRTSKAADTRQAVMTSARRFFATKGFAATENEEIVEAAHLTRGALYYHFRDKTDLFRAVVRAVAGDVAQRLTSAQLARADQGSAGAWEDLRAGFQTFLDVCSDGEFQKIVLIDGTEVLGRSSWEGRVIEQGLAPLRDWLRQAIDDGEVDPLPIDALTRLVAAVFVEAGFFLAHADDQLRAREEVSSAGERILMGLRVSSEG